MAGPPSRRRALGSSPGALRVLRYGDGKKEKEVRAESKSRDAFRSAKKRGATGIVLTNRSIPKHFPTLASTPLAEPASRKRFITTCCATASPSKDRPPGSIRARKRPRVDCAGTAED